MTHELLRRVFPALLCFVDGVQVHKFSFMFFHPIARSHSCAPSRHKMYFSVVAVFGEDGGLMGPSLPRGAMGEKRFYEISAVGVDNEVSRLQSFLSRFMSVLEVKSHAASWCVDLNHLVSIILHCSVISVCLKHPRKTIIVHTEKMNLKEICGVISHTMNSVSNEFRAAWHWTAAHTPPTFVASARPPVLLARQATATGPRHVKFEFLNITSFYPLMHVFTLCFLWVSKTWFCKYTLTWLSLILAS